MPNPRQFSRGLLAVACAGVLVLAACGSDDSSTTAAGTPLPIGADRAGEAMLAMDGAAEDMAWTGWVPIHFVAGDGLPSLGEERPAFVLVPDERDLAAVADRLGTTVVDFRDTAPPDGEFREVDPEEPVQDPGPPDAVFDDEATDDTIDGGLLGPGMDLEDPTVMTNDGGEWFYFDHRSDLGGMAIAECDPDGVCPDNSQQAPTSTSVEEAEAIARDLLDGIGPGLEGASIATEGAWGTWNITVRYRVEGHEVDGLHASVTVGDNGEIIAASGLTGTFDALGAYPTLDTAGAIDRMNDGWYTFGDDATTFGPTPLVSEPMTTEAGGDADAEDRPDTSPEFLEPDDTEPMPMPEPVDPPDPVIVTLTDVALGLSVFHAWDGTGLYVVPTYVFTGDDDNRYSVPAVTDDVIAPPELIEPDGQIEPGNVGEPSEGP